MRCSTSCILAVVPVGEGVYVTAVTKYKRCIRPGWYLIKRYHVYFLPLPRGGEGWGEGEELESMRLRCFSPLILTFSPKGRRD
jgi:hypothetical protein